MTDTAPFEDVEGAERNFRLPKRKWRELLFIGAIVPDGEHFVRDPSRPLPRFRRENLFPEGVRFHARDDGEGWVFVSRLD